MPPTRASRGACKRLSCKELREAVHVNSEKHREEVRAHLETARVLVDYVKPAPFWAPGEPVLPAHITKELYDKAVQLQTKFLCSQCRKMLTQETLSFAPCGHLYCVGCYVHERGCRTCSRDV